MNVYNLFDTRAVGRSIPARGSCPEVYVMLCTFTVYQYFIIQNMLEFSRHKQL